MFYALKPFHGKPKGPEPIGSLLEKIKHFEERWKKRH